MKSISDISSLLEEAQKATLYQKLIDQLNKDFNYATVQLDLDENSTPVELKKELQAVIYWLRIPEFTLYN